MEPKYYAIKVTSTYQNGEVFTFYHTGGRGNGAFANVYEEHQVKWILGQYNSGRETEIQNYRRVAGVRKAEAIEVMFK